LIGMVDTPHEISIHMRITDIDRAIEKLEREVGRLARRRPTPGSGAAAFRWSYRAERQIALLRRRRSTLEGPRTDSSSSRSSRIDTYVAGAQP
jgi:hypothetical protein